MGVLGTFGAIVVDLITRTTRRCPGTGVLVQNFLCNGAFSLVRILCECVVKFYNDYGLCMVPWKMANQLLGNDERLQCANRLRRDGQYPSNHAIETCLLSMPLDQRRKSIHTCSLDIIHTLHMLTVVGVSTRADITCQSFHRAKIHTQHCKVNHLKSSSKKVIPC